MDTTSRKQTVLITGGRSLLGRRLTEYLRGKGYRILWLTRDVSGGMDMCDETFFWDIEQGTIAEHPLLEADVIIHLAGASLSGERWTKRRKREILRSRVRSARLITNALARLDHHVHTLIYASSTGFYSGEDSPLGALPSEENEAPGLSFLSQTFAMLEREAQLAQERLGLRTVVLRNGVILDPYAGVLPNLIIPVRFGLNTPLGRGDQFVNWIHQQDICRIYERAIRQSEMQGVYNAVAPAPVTNSQLMDSLSALYGHDHLRLRIPSVILRTLLGEMSERILSGRAASADKVRALGFAFNHASIGQALRACLK